MQYQHEGDCLLQVNIESTEKMNARTFEVAVEDQPKDTTKVVSSPEEEEETFSMEASLSRIDALAESLSDLTRKRVDQSNLGGRYRVKKRPSIGSTCSGAGTSMCSGSSLAIDEIASIDSTFLASSIDGFSGVDLAVSRLSLGDGEGDGSTSSARTTSRLTNGMWSYQDIEPWVCGICTFENEPVFLSCEMCGQTKAASCRLQNLNPNMHSQQEEERQRERTRLLQEQRLQELQDLQRPVDAPPVPSTVAVGKMPRHSKRKSRNTKSSNSSVNSSTTIPTVASTTTMPSVASSPPERKRRSGGGIPGSHNIPPNTAPMEDHSLQNVFEFSPAVHKFNPKPDPQDSIATERTFDMDQSAWTNAMDQSHIGSMDHSSYLMGQSSRQWNSSRRSGGGGGGHAGRGSKAFRVQQQSQWFEGMDEISDEISV